jgi:hypothetical protein
MICTHLIVTIRMRSGNLLSELLMNVFCCGFISEYFFFIRGQRLRWMFGYFFGFAALIIVPDYWDIRVNNALVSPFLMTDRIMS